MATQHGQKPIDTLHPLSQASTFSIYLFYSDKSRDLKYHDDVITSVWHRFLPRLAYSNLLQ